MSEPHTIPPHEPLDNENDPTGRWRIAELEAERDDFQQRLLDELAKNALTPTGRDRLEQAEAELDALDVKYVTVQHELAALKCCGNCKWFRAVEYQECGHPDVPYENYYISAPDKCDFTPSRWTPRS
jgi:hypothetical protein